LGVLEREEIAKILRGNTILECGVGTGRNALIFGKSSLFLGVDISKKMLINCKVRLRSEKIEVNLIQADVHNLPLQEGIFKTVIFSRSFKFFFDPLKSLIEAQKVLKKGGKLVVTSPLLNSTSLRIAIKIGLIKPLLENATYYTSDQIFNLLSQANFASSKIIAVGNMFFGLYSFLWFNLYKSLGRLFRCFPNPLLIPIFRIHRRKSYSYVLVEALK
jgi:ubiquinone/menaquinone biosynthesis C-methylase UbiE